MKNSLVRPATLNDLPEILRIQALCYSSIEPEKPAAYINKLEEAPDCAFVIEDEKELLAYIFSLPIQLDNPPKLDSSNYQKMANANCLYLHDLAIDPKARGLGLSKYLMERYFETARLLQMEYGSLIAIQNSESFWHGYGFNTQQTTSQSTKIKEKLNSYGDALYMTQRLTQA